ncbi:MAG: hypothetical protein KBD53_10765 [Candidatus Omnitrophica bacterium]|nr:hypothetical protein [Candidatus Omnitrophota bacterium]
MKVMKLKNLFLALMCLLALAGANGCAKTSVDEKVEDAAERTGAAIEDAADKTGDALHRAADKID